MFREEQLTWECVTSYKLKGSYDLYNPSKVSVIANTTDEASGM
jgi:hypothetical protein